MGSGRTIVAAGTDEPFRHLLTVDEFLILDEAGAFDTIGRHVELIDGEIFVMAPLRRPHARTLMILSTALDLATEALGNGMEAMTPVSAELDGLNLPEADIVVAEAADERFVTPRTVRLLVEVSAS